MKTQRDTYHHGDLRQALIDAALELISERDISELSLREVARRVGVSHAAPYRHFSDKDALLAAIAEEGFHVLTRYLQESVQTILDDPLKQLQATGVAYVQFAVNHSSHYRVMFGAFRANNPDYSALTKAGEATFAVLVNVIMTGQTAGVFSTGEPRQLAWAAWSLVHGLAMLLIDQQLPLSDEQAITSIATLATQTLAQGMQRS
ncbi:MAG: TetR/AcrR family transcriptional regulator [Coleofasciculus sp. S288]|nr:TetR/AcrR family transcriptional regulator [Coleofasciculus sp. S288]